MRIETPNGEIIFFGDAEVRSIQSMINRSETPTDRRYYARVSTQENSYGDSFEITEPQYNQLKEALFEAEITAE